MAFCIKDFLSIVVSPLDKNVFQVDIVRVRCVFQQFELAVVTYRNLYDRNALGIMINVFIAVQTIIHQTNGFSFYFQPNF